MELIFNYKLILSFLTGVVSMPKLPKIASLQYSYYLNFSYVHKPPSHESNPLHKCQSKTIANDCFYLKKKKVETRVQ